MATYERFTSLDRFFLDVESDNTHMHVAGAMLFEAGPLRTPEGGIDIERIRQYIGSRLHLIPRYRQRLAYVPLENHPVWVDDDHMNIRYHVRHSSLPRPGSLRQLKRLAGRIMSQKLDRGKPLWELWIIEGLEDDRFAMISKTHHCMIDGVSGVDLMGVLLSASAQREFDAPPNWNPQPAPSGLQMLRDEVWRRATMPLDLLGLAREAASQPRELCMRARDAATALTGMLGEGMRGASDTPLNRSVGSYRRFDWITMDLADVKRVKNALGGTVNDVVLAIVAGAAGRFLEHRGITRKQQEQMEFRVFCPVSVRDPSERGRLGNKVSGMIIPLPVDERDPHRLMATIHQNTSHVKESKQALGAEVLAAVSDFTVPVLLSLGARLATRTRAYNMIVTNVPGPQLPLYMLGARLAEAFPLVPLFVNQALGVALFSYDGKLCWGFNSDWDLVPDLHDFVEALQTSFAELVAAAGADQSSGPDADPATNGDAGARRGSRQGSGAADDAPTGSSSQG